MSARDGKDKSGRNPKPEQVEPDEQIGGGTTTRCYDIETLPKEESSERVPERPKRDAGDPG